MYMRLILDIDYGDAQYPAIEVAAALEEIAETLEKDPSVLRDENPIEMGPFTLRVEPELFG